MDIKQELIKIAKILDFNTFKNNVLKDLNNYKKLEDVDWRISGNQIFGKTTVKTETRNMYGDWSKNTDYNKSDDFESYIYDCLIEYHRGNYKFINIREHDYHDYYDNGIEYSITIDLKHLYDLYSKGRK